MMDTLLNMVKKAGDKNMFVLDNRVMSLRGTSRRGINRCFYHHSFINKRCRRNSPASFY